MTIRGITVGSGIVVTCTAMALGFATAAPALAAPELSTTTSLATPTVATLSAPSALTVYRETNPNGETYNMAARAPLTGGTGITGIYFVLKDVKTGIEVDNSWVGRGSEDTSVYSTSMTLDNGTTYALAKHDLVLQATAYRSSDSGSTIASQTPARAMIYAKNRAQVQRVNRVKSTWDSTDGSLALTWNSPNYSGDGQVVIFNIWDAKGDLLAQVNANNDLRSPTSGTNSVVLDPATARQIDGKIEIIPGVIKNHRTGDPWWITVGTQSVL